MFFGWGTTLFGYSFCDHRIAAELRPFHHTLNAVVCNTIKPHCVGGIRILLPAKKSLVRPAKILEQYKLCSERSSRLFQQPTRLIKQNTCKPSRKRERERDIYEHSIILNIDSQRWGTLAKKQKIQHQPITVKKLEVLSRVRRISVLQVRMVLIINYWWKKTSSDLHLTRVFDTWLNQQQPITT